MAKEKEPIITKIDIKEKTAEPEIVVVSKKELASQEKSEAKVSHANKKALENAYKELYDSPDGLCGWYLGRVVFGDTESAESVVKKIGEVTREQIMEVAEKMQLDTVFMLKGVAKECTPVSEEGEL